MLDPLIADMEARSKAAGVKDMFDTDSGPEARARANHLRANFYPRPDIAVGSATTELCDGPRGAIELRVVRPIHGRGSATVVYFHGGGWIVGDLESHAAHAARIADEADATVINVGYRLAPEEPFPAGVEDALAATRHVWKNIAHYGGDKAKFAVAGDSAGGNLAAVAAIMCRDEGIALRAQLLLYPATNLAGRSEDRVHRHYFGGKALENSGSWKASPALASSLGGLAPTILGFGKYDFLYKDNEAFAAKLRAAGNDLTCREFPDLNHGFFSFTKISQSALKAAQLLCADLKHRLHG